MTRGWGGGGIIRPLKNRGVAWSRAIPKSWDPSDGKSAKLPGLQRNRGHKVSENTTFSTFDHCQPKSNNRGKLAGNTFIEGPWWLVKKISGDHGGLTKLLSRDHGGSHSIIVGVIGGGHFKIRGVPLLGRIQKAWGVIA